MPESRVRRGYLVLADISGYTAFLTGNELEHANAIIEELSREIVASLGQALRVVKLEGDAVFCYALEEAFASPERILEAMEACYCRFADHQLDMQRQTTCTCSACSEISTLDLKLLAHYGEFVQQRIGQAEDLAGPDVILIHRLLKNTVHEALGLRAYALLTQPLATRFSPMPALPSHEEEIDGFGTLPVHVEDLRPVATGRRDARRVFIGDSEADMVAEVTVPLSPAEAWEWWLNPERSLQWSGGFTGWEDHPDDHGRMRSGASAHCAHGKGSTFVRYLDWRPFSYVSTEKEPVRKTFSTPPHLIDTAEFIPVEGGTRVVYRCRLENRSLSNRIQVRLMRPLLRRQFAADERRLRAILAGEGALTAQ